MTMWRDWLQLGVSVLVCIAAANEARRVRGGKEVVMASRLLRVMLGPRSVWVWVAALAAFGTGLFVDALVMIAN